MEILKDNVSLLDQVDILNFTECPYGDENLWDKLPFAFLGCTKNAKSVKNVKIPKSNFETTIVKLIP